MKTFPKRILRIIVGIILGIIYILLTTPMLLMWLFTGKISEKFSKILNNEFIGNVTEWVLIGEIPK